MPIVIKEIHVSTVVEKKVILPEEISERTYERLKQKGWRNFRNTARAFVQKEERKNVEQH